MSEFFTIDSKITVEPYYYLQNESKLSVTFML